MDIKTRIHEMKKVILHLHLDGSLRPETVQEWLHENNEDIDLDTVKAKLMVAKDCKDLNQYLEKFELPISLLQTEEHLKRAIYELYEDLAKQNTLYAEVRFAPCSHLTQGLSYEQIVEAAISGMNEAKEKYDIDGNLILSCRRGSNNQNTNMATVKVAKKYLGKGVCALDLVGEEALFPTKDFEYIFSKSKELDIPFTIHAGEADGIESIQTAIRFGARRIGHGIRCIENEELMQEIKDKNILLEICPTSNIQTQAFLEQNGNKHPIEKIFKFGIPISLNPDNNTLSNTDIEQEYEWVLNNTNLTTANLIKMNLDSIKASFLPDIKKLKLANKIMLETKNINGCQTQLYTENDNNE